MLLSALVLLLSLFLVWPLAWLIGLLMSRPRAPKPGLAKLATWLMVLLAALALAYVVGLLVAVLPAAWRGW